MSGSYDELVKALRYCIDGTCGNCPYVEKCKKNGRAVDQLHKDAAAAIEALEAEVKRLELDNEDYEYTLRERYDEPKRGEWVKGADGLYHCSVCGATAPYLDAFDGVIQYWDNLFYCPNCGAKMEVQE